MVGAAKSRRMTRIYSLRLTMVPLLTLPNINSYPTGMKNKHPALSIDYLSVKMHDIGKARPSVQLPAFDSIFSTSASTDIV